MSTLRRLRIDAGLSISELAKRSGISADQISSIENGHTKNPRGGTLKSLANALGDDVRPSDLDPVLNGGNERRSAVA